MMCLLMISLLVCNDGVIWIQRGSDSASFCPHLACAGRLPMSKYIAGTAVDLFGGIH